MKYISYRFLFFILIAVVACVATVGLYSFAKAPDSINSELFSSNQDNDPNTVRFIPIGDSYTIGLGVSNPEDRWPNLLVKSLKQEGITVELVANPSVSGYEGSDAISRELPLFEREKPDFGTLFIGANDAFRQNDLGQFTEDYRELVDRMQNALTNRQNLVLITIPNYARFPQGVRYGANGREEQLIEEYNTVIREEAENRNLKVVDLFQIDSMNSQDFFISDGIHPNPKGIKIWHDAIYPVARDVLKPN